MKNTSLITLFELKQFKKFLRWQEIPTFYDNHGLEQDSMPLGYPIFETRHKSNNQIDLFIENEWKNVELKKIEDGNIVYKYKKKEFKKQYNKYIVAPSGVFTKYNWADTPKIEKAELTDKFKLSDYNQYLNNHTIHKASTKIERIDVPYITFKISYYNSSAKWVDYFDSILATFHIADPRINVENIKSIQPYYNNPIAISHRWLHHDHPDPKQLQFNDFLRICEELDILDIQPFFIDYCSLPQLPRSESEEELFQFQIVALNDYFKKQTIILPMGAIDYHKRAWCMIEFFISSKHESILNMSDIEDVLKQAFDMTQQYNQIFSWNTEAIKKHNADFTSWSKNLENVMIHNTRIEKEKSIKKYFESLEITNKEDRKYIASFLDKDIL